MDGSSDYISASYGREEECINPFLFGPWRRSTLKSFSSKCKCILNGSIHKEDLRDLGVTTYIDEIAVATHTVEGHRHVLEKVLRRLHKHGVQLR